MTSVAHESKTKLLNAAMNVIRAKGYAGTTIDDVCAAAGVTKGSFFHHFKSKDELALAAAAHWGTVTDAIFASAPYQHETDPLSRLLGYLDCRIAMLGTITAQNMAEYTCLLGTLVQETFATHPDIRAACEKGMASQVEAVTRDVEAAKKRYAPRATWSAQSVAYFIQVTLQGCFVLAKAQQDVKVAGESLAHLRRYLVEPFNTPGGASYSLRRSSTRSKSKSRSPS
ncbi:MAG: TetR/AcrR family transcriptional regulator [Steroidobacteraceae bacterium]